MRSITTWGGVLVVVAALAYGAWLGHTMVADLYRPTAGSIGELGALMRAGLAVVVVVALFLGWAVLWMIQRHRALRRAVGLAALLLPVALIASAGVTWARFEAAVPKGPATLALDAPGYEASQKTSARCAFGRETRIIVVALLDPGTLNDKPLQATLSFTNLDEPEMSVRVSGAGLPYNWHGKLAIEGRGDERGGRAAFALIGDTLLRSPPSATAPEVLGMTPDGREWPGILRGTVTWSCGSVQP